MRVLIVHGIHTNADAPWMYVYANEFRRAGWEAVVWTYGHAKAIFTRFQNPGRARKLADMVRPGDVVLGHSNGGCLAWMAAELGAPISGAILLNPALDTDKAMASHVRWVNLYPNRFDKAVPLAAWFGLRDIAPHPWGAQGRDGISVQDERYRTTFTDEVDPRVKGHSAMLLGSALVPWCERVVREATDRAGG